jgi:uncharacterized protein YgiM (DUF1202 family)
MLRTFAGRLSSVAVATATGCLLLNGPAHAASQTPTHAPASATQVTPSTATHAPHASSAGAASGTAATAAVPIGAVMAYDCEVTPMNGNVNVRSGPGTNYSIETTLQEDEVMESECETVAGGSFVCDGSRNNRWVPVHIGLFWYGYVARDCVALGLK